MAHPLQCPEFAHRTGRRGGPVKISPACSTGKSQKSPKSKRPGGNMPAVAGLKYPFAAVASLGFILLLQNLKEPRWMAPRFATPKKLFANREHLPVATNSSIPFHVNLPKSPVVERYLTNEQLLSQCLEEQRLDAPHGGFVKKYKQGRRLEFGLGDVCQACTRYFYRLALATYLVSAHLVQARPLGPLAVLEKDLAADNRSLTVPGAVIDYDHPVDKERLIPQWKISLVLAVILATANVLLVSIIILCIFGDIFGHLIDCRNARRSATAEEEPLNLETVWYSSSPVSAETL
eukprot:GHVT01049586.1.p1 GENE.GHVT01049586.1~~GHVT01049586.1.p1  ORF type:complete len:291 (+),score=32.81 GHVT01049586.1:1056-1928(+)